MRCHSKVSKNFILAGPPAAVWRLNVKGKSGCRENSEGVISTVLVQEDLGYSSDAKEAVAFVVLGYLTLNKKSGNVPSATGSRKNVILGNIYLGKWV